MYAKNPPSSRGKWTVLAIFILGTAVMIGLFLTPRHPLQSPTTTPASGPIR
jgi:hypothetical protein